ncbi:hypothetical protein BDK51DRAFT_45949 [Blyttiomyces helicus]|uniref:Uncharacterized protein n=1 Tax=Blyttiomyces helicus TaxID=388810 RepID=A0A4P9W7V3_9FUNG|nr:hypothetical protein BDK51DRAFT_45949 [Blyttiomyces helicus]|eukprot:RKO88464.1 hypothetical protein BDK51DRAFT_45949 [Blyttiomyces helicus]
MTTLGPTGHFLNIGMIHNRSAGSMILSQRHYIANPIRSCGLVRATPCDTPVVSSAQLEPAAADRVLPPKVVATYQSVVGKLLNAASATCPDMAFAVLAFGQLNAEPSLPLIRIKRQEKGGGGSDW